MVETHNQTQFAAEEPFLEDPIVIPQAPQVAKPAVAFFKRRKTIVSLIVAVTLLLLFVLYIVNIFVMRSRRLGEDPELLLPTPTPVITNKMVDGVERLRGEWRAADPTQIELQPPAIDLQIRLDQNER